jgi:hypothetical protein
LPGVRLAPLKKFSVELALPWASMPVLAVVDTATPSKVPRLAPEPETRIA